jgi:hypothetical protein
VLTREHQKCERERRGKLSNNIVDYFRSTIGWLVVVQHLLDIKLYKKRSNWQGEGTMIIKVLEDGGQDRMLYH